MGYFWSCVLFTSLLFITGWLFVLLGVAEGYQGGYWLTQAILLGALARSFLGLFRRNQISKTRDKE